MASYRILTDDQIRSFLDSGYLMHPFMLHASSQNVLGVPRFMTNPPVVLREPLDLNRADPGEFSLLERATLHYLGLERLDFQPTAPRESFWWPAEQA